MIYEIDKINYLQIGVQGENIARKIQIDMTSWVNELEADNVSGYTFGLVFKPYNDPNKYPMVTTYNSETHILSWRVSNEATQTPGVGYTEIRAQESTSGLVKKTRIIPTSVEESVSGNETTPPAVQQGWVTQVLNSAAAVLAAAHGQQIRFAIDSTTGHLVFSYSDDEEVTDDTEWTDVDLGPVDAYAIAVLKGYTGTAAQFAQYMADIANGASNAAISASQAAASAADALEHTQDVIEDWLEENIDPETGYALDTTLTLSNAAAPANLVGNIKSAIRDDNASHGIRDSIISTGLKFTNSGVDYIVQNNGTIEINGTATATRYIKISNTVQARSSVQSGWKEETINMVKNREYIVCVTPVSGSFSGAVSAGFALRNSSDENIVTFSFASSDEGLFKNPVFSKKIYVGNVLPAYAMLVIRSGSVFTNVKIKVELIDVANLSEFASKSGDGYYDDVRRADNKIYHHTGGGHTSYYYTIVPKLDSFGNLIPIEAVYYENGGPLDYAVANHTTLNTNAGMGSNGGNCAVITNGVVTREADYPSDTSLPIYSYLKYVGFDENRNILEYPLNTSTETMLNDGVKNACVAYYKLVEDGEQVDISQLPLPEGNMGHKMRMCMFVRENGDIGFLACDGEFYREGQLGFTPSELAEVVISLGAVDAWNLDGGGSTSLVWKGVKQNSNKDNKGLSDRQIKILWSVPKQFSNEMVQFSSSQIGEEKERLLKMLIYMNNATMCRSATVSLTTDSSGISDVTVSDSYIVDGAYMLMSLYADGYIVTPFLKNGSWKAKVTDESGNIVASQSISATCYYHL